MLNKQLLTTARSWYLMTDEETAILVASFGNELNAKLKSLRGQFVGKVLRSNVSYAGDPEDVDRMFEELLNNMDKEQVG